MTAVLTSPVPETPEQLTEFLNDPARMKAEAEAGTLQSTLKAATVAIVNRDKTIEEQVGIQLQQQMAEYIKSKGGETAPLDLTTARKLRSRSTKRDLVNHGQHLRVTEYHNPKNTAAALDGRFEDFGEFLQAASTAKVVDALPNSAEVKAKISELFKIQNAYASNVPADGGFLIPDEFASEVLSVSLETSLIRPRATVLPMSNLRLIVPSIDSTSNVSSVFGGIVAYWTEAAAAATASSASFGRVQLDAKKLLAYAEYENELVADAPAFGALLSQLMPQAISFYEDIAFFTGSGVGEPLGFINCPASVSVNKEVGQAAATIVWENIAGMYQRMLPSSLGSAIWLADIGSFKELATMALSVGTGGSAIWLNNGTQGPPMTILGRPVLFTEKASVLGTTGDINFVDLRYYLIGDRQQMQVAASDQYKFGNDMQAYRIIERLDGQPWLNSAITPHNNGNTLSPFVQLQTRS